MKRLGKYAVLMSLFWLVAVIFAVALADSLPSLEELRSKANQGDPTSQFLLGVAYDQGRGVSRNQTDAAHWYRKAAERGNAAAQNSLGSMYQNGQGVSLDNAEAVRWYQKAVDQDYGEACTNLGYMYDNGLGVKQDKQKAVKLYQTAAEKGSLRGMLNVGVSYWKGEGTSKDLFRAYMWLDLARFYTQRISDMQLKWHVRAAYDQLKKEMTEQQISAAEKLAKEWDASHRSKWQERAKGAGQS